MSNLNNQNNFYNVPNWSGNNPNWNYSQQMQYQANARAPKQSNKVYVSGYEAARAYPTPFNSDMLLCDDALDVIYNVETDYQGRKTIQVLDVALHKETPKVDANALEARIAKLEEAVLNTKTEESV